MTSSASADPILALKIAALFQIASSLLAARVRVGEQAAGVS